MFRSWFFLSRYYAARFWSALGGTPVLVNTPAERIVVVPGESRLYLVAAESRLCLVAAESRIVLVVDEDRAL